MQKQEKHREGPAPWTSKFCDNQRLARFHCLLDSSACILGSVSLTGGIGDVGSESLVIALSNHKTLKHVDIGKCSDIATNGWRGLSASLSAPDSALEGLEIDGCEINDDGVALIFAALCENMSLRKLNLARNFDITSEGWEKCFRLALVSEFNLETISQRQFNR